MAIAFVQEDSSTGSTSVVLDLPAPPTPGNLLVVVCESQTSHNNQSLTGFTKAAGAGTGTGTALWYRVVQAGDGQQHTVSITSGASSEAQITEWSGITTTSPLDDTDTGVVNPAAQTGTVGPVDPTVADSLVISGIGVSNTVTNFAETGDLTLRRGGSRLGTADLIRSTIASTNSTYTWTTNRTGNLVMAVFKGGAVTVAGSQATETDTANVGAPQVRPAGTQATEADSAFGGVAAVASAGTQATETDQAFAGTALVTVNGTQANEADTANGGTPAVTVQGSLATETDSPLGGAPAVALVGARATETDSPFGGSSAVAVLGQRATETDTAHAGSTSGGVSRNWIWNVGAPIPKWRTGEPASKWDAGQPEPAWAVSAPIE